MGYTGMSSLGLRLKKTDHLFCGCRASLSPEDRWNLDAGHCLQLSGGKMRRRAEIEVVKEIYEVCGKTVDVKKL
jgi:hypothetical protein